MMMIRKVAVVMAIIDVVCVSSWGAAQDFRWGGRLTEEDKADVGNYIRALVPFMAIS